jgi:DNA-binding GntR family transcriptional regulator
LAQTRKRDCLDDLRMRILTLRLQPGAAIDEASLAAGYGVSRTPFREVLQRLAGEGYVELLDNRGAKVASMDLATLRTFYQTAPLVYASIARLAAAHRTPAQLDALREAQGGFVAANAAGDAGAAAMANHRFHGLIGEMAHNPYLMAALRRMLVDHTRLSQTFYRPASPAEEGLILKASAQHDAMIAAIAARDADLATDLTLQHWDLSRDRMERFVRPDPLPLDMMSLTEQARAI